MGHPGRRLRHTRRSLSRNLVIAIAIACFVMVVPAVAPAAFPGTNPNESPRVNTPNDPDFDRCEEDDEQGPPDCSTYFNEEFRAFGFSPDTANEIPNPGGLLPHYTTGTSYVDCSQLDADGQAANKLAEGFAANDNSLPAQKAACLQQSGVRADMAWKYSTGRPDVTVAILDTGIRWQDPELRLKVHLNRGELPIPLWDRGANPIEGGACGSVAPNPGVYNADGSPDGAFNVRDYRCDSRVSIEAGDEEADGILDASDLIAVFSDGVDDGNGYIDDIAGWDFFDDDNDPFDVSSCCSANGHGTGRAREAAADTDNGQGGVGMCPECQVMPLKVWDSFVVPIDSFALATVYAADNGAAAVGGAVGGLGNSQFARRAFQYADQRGVALMMVSSDINSANHNYPTNYNEAVYVAGAFPDTAPNETCSGPGGLPGLGDVLNPPEQFEEGCEEFLDLLGQGGVTPSTQPLTTSFFRNSNLTQYGGKADIVLEATTGSENTGQAAGAAGLLASFGRQQFGDANPLSGNEIRQLLTMTAEDVLPANTGTIGQPDKAAAGWDPHFGYGRVNLAGAMKRIANDRVPPEAQINSPDWFSPINVDRVPASGVDVTAHIAAPHGAVGNWRLEYACGQDAPDADFQAVPGASGSGDVDDGVIGTLSKSLLEGLADNCDGQVSNDAGRPAGTATDPWPADPYSNHSGGNPAQNTDPERHAFQIRLTVESTAAEGGASNFGRYRKTLFAYNDDGNHPGWPRPMGAGSDASNYITGSGGEVSARLYDIDGDNDLEIIQGTTSGELYALNAAGGPVASFNGGQPVRTDPYQIVQDHPVPGSLPTPRESLRVPAIGDINGDREAEIVATAGEHVYVWDLEGNPVSGFPVGVDRSLSEPCRPGVEKPCFDVADRAIFTDDRGTPASEQKHIKRGFAASPALADLDCDGNLDIVAGSLDQHLYAWEGNGDLLPGFPRKLSSPGAVGAEIVTSPAIAELDGRDCSATGTGPKGPEVVVATNEVIPADPGIPSNPGFPGSILEIFNILISNATGSNPVYAVHSDGSGVAGWPVAVGVAAGDLLPFVLPGHDAAVVNPNGGTDEVSVSAATSVEPGGTRLVNGSGATVTSYVNGPANSPDQGPVINLADYQSVGDILGAGEPAVVKGGLTVNGAANLLAVNQNLPFSHVEQAWSLDPSSAGEALPGFPVATDDFQLLSQASIARVSGSGPSRQALVGTGLYQLHAYGPGGLDASGWPKFTGGWMQATPAVGDADGDGELEVTTVTREGWSFLWDTGVDACDGSNDEWWTFHHDEHSTNNYGADGRPPGTPRGLGGVHASDGSVDLSWIAPGDDWLCGQADQFQIIASEGQIEHPSDGTVVKQLDAGASADQPETASLTAAELGSARFLAVLYRDEAGNWGRLASVAVPANGKISARGRVQTAQGPEIAFSAANDCNPSLSTRPSIVTTSTGGRIWTKTNVTTSSCTDQPPSSPLGFDTQTGTATGTFGPSAPGGRNGQQGTLQWTYRESPDTVQFTLRDSSNTVVYQANEQTPGSLRGTPGGVWTFAP